MHLSTSTVAGETARGNKSSIFPGGYIAAFLLTTSVFFFWGMSNNLSDILVRQFMKSFQLHLLQAQLVQTSIFVAYALMATPAAMILQRFGYKSGLVIGLSVFGVGTLLFWPAAMLGHYTPFLIALFIVGSGQSILETTANPLIAQFGDPGSSEQRLNFSQAFNPPGTITGVLVGTLFIFSGVEKSKVEVRAMQAQGSYAAYLHGEIMRVVPTYVVMGIVVLILAVCISRARFPKSMNAIERAPHPGTYRRLLRNRGLMFAVLAQFFYCGAQIGTWSTMIVYLRAYTALNDRSAGYFLTGNLIALMLGRIVSTPLMRSTRPSSMIAFYAVVNCALLALGISRPGMIGADAILLTSFFMSVMFPTIFALGVKGLGDDTKVGGSFLVMAIAGGAFFPPLMGWIADKSGSVALGYVLPALGYIVVATYAYAVPKITRASVDVYEVDVAPHDV